MIIHKKYKKNNILVDIIYKKFPSQKRTLKFLMREQKMVKTYEFPEMYFAVIERYNNNIYRYSNFSLFFLINGKMHYTDLINTCGASVCLGKLTNYDFCTENELNLEECIDDFWMTSFNSESAKPPEKLFFYLHNSAIIPNFLEEKLNEGWEES